MNTTAALAVPEFLTRPVTDYLRDLLSWGCITQAEYDRATPLFDAQIAAAATGDAVVAINEDWLEKLTLWQQYSAMGGKK